MLIRNFKQFTLKTFQTNLKKGWNTEDFGSFFGLNEEELYTQMCQIFSPKSADKLRRRMRKNPGTNAIKRIVPEAEVPLGTVEARFDLVDKISNTEFGIPVNQLVDCFAPPEVASPKIEDSSSTTSSQLESLESKKAELKEELKLTESKISHSSEVIAHIKEDATAISHKLNELLTKISSLKELEREHSSILSESTTEKEVLTEELEKVNSAILELQLPKIFIEADGTIEIESSIPVLFEGWEKYFEELLKNEASEDFTIKQLRAIAKLKTYMEEGNCEYIIGDDDLNAFFNSLI